MRSIVCFGEALIDFRGEPAAAGEVCRFVQQAGGAPANVATAVARLGGHAEFVGMLGDDMFGRFLGDSLSSAGVGIGHARWTREAPTALAFVSLDVNGERSFSFYRPPSADLLFRGEDFDAAMFSHAAVFHVCSNSLTDEGIAAATLEGLRQARAGGALVSFDMNLRPALWPRDVDPSARIWQVLACADVVKLSAEEFAFLGGADALVRLWLGAARLLVVTDGAAPLRWRTPERSGELAGFDVRAVDTTAAGDAFVGGLLLQLAARRVTSTTLTAFTGDETALTSALRFASACGALAVTRCGAFSAMPTLADVEALLASGRPRDPQERDCA